MAWDDLWAALALVLVLEGLLPALAPRAFREALAQMAAMPDRVLRALGLASMVAGALLLYWVRHS
jgi:uncharacterized protein YjeT (DUF2065 family)